MTTAIVFTANARALRHIISLRTANGAEEEIRLIFWKIAELCFKSWPLLFQDMKAIPGDDDIPQFTFEHDKI